MLGSGVFFFFFMVFLFWLHAVAVLRPLCLRKGLKHWDVDRQHFFLFSFALPIPSYCSTAPK